MDWSLEPSTASEIEESVIELPMMVRAQDDQVSDIVDLLHRGRVGEIADWATMSDLDMEGIATDLAGSRGTTLLEDGW